MSKYNSLKFEPDVVAGEPSDLLEQGMEMVLKYGKYQGRALKDLVVTPDGRSYLQWMVRPEASFKESMKERIRCVLSFAEERLRKA